MEIQNPLDLLKQLLGVKTEPDDAEVEKSWTQVAKLSTEDTLRRRNLNAETAARQREYKMHAKKMMALKATNDAEADEWWNHLYRTYGLPEAEYHILDDGRIFTKPKEKKDAPAA